MPSLLGNSTFSFVARKEPQRWLILVQILGLLGLSALLGACGVTASQSSGQGSPPPPGVSVSISPPSATVQTGGTQQFSATVTNSSNTGVNWSVSGSGCLGAACGTLSSTSGSPVTYTAPGNVPSPAQVTVTATSAADSSASASASVTITSTTSVSVSISPMSATVQTGHTQQFTATVTNSSNTAVNWSLSSSGCTGSACGTISPTSTASGAPVTYTAPPNVPSPAQVTVTATSAADSSASASASVTITSAPPPSALNCTGTPLTQNQSDATSQFANVAPGVKITQLTSSGANFISYMDIPASNPTHSFICYMHTDTAAMVRAAVCANPDGTNAQTIYDGMAGKVYVSVDGQWVYGTRGNPGGATEDIYGVNVTNSGPCNVQPITNLNMVPVTGETDTELSTSAIDPTTGLNVIAFAPGIIVKRVLTNGTLLPDITPPNISGSTFYHRLRLNPVFPNVLAYKPENSSNTAGVPNEFLCDLSLGCPTAITLDTLTNGEINHGVWPVFLPAQDVNFFYQGNNTGQLYQAGALTAGGVIIPSPINTLIGPPPSTTETCNFVSMLLDGSNGWICSSNTSGSATDVFKMSADGSTVTKLFTITKAPQQDAGVPVVNVLNSTTFLFRSDISGTPQVYAVTGF